MTAREIALRALYDIDVKQTFTNAAIKDALAKELSAADRGLITELIYGVVSNKTAIDFIISRYSSIKLKKITPWVLNILRMGVFQIYYMDRIPHSAACNEAVKLAKKYSHRAGSGFVNGVLRSFSREAESFEFPNDKGEAEFLALKYSYPIWLTEKLVAEYGEDKCKELFEENTKAHGTFIRANILRNSTDELLDILKSEGLECECTGFENCIKIQNGISIDKSVAYSEGRYSLQNISSQKAVAALEVQPGETVIDMCAAPGGKSCAIAEKMNNEGQVISFDIFEHKVELIKKAATRLGIDIIDARLHDASVVCENLIESADRVLVDVPCSGLGVIHKKPDIKWNRTQSDINELCCIQEKILETACRYVKSGGVMVYSTCTIIPEENRIQTEKFLKKHGEFEKLSEEQILTSGLGESGFYICKMIRKKNNEN